MIFMCLQLLCYFGVSCRAGMMAAAQGDTFLPWFFWVQKEMFLYFFVFLHFCFFQDTWEYHIISLRFTINMKKDRK